ncbi:MAG TPA: hypothetical protein VHC22_10225 [Pirellulales bacterium]|nr:hypothetical protein [Pirellulales bacterium]
MNRASLDQLVNAVLYEGYLLYPYRRSTKNQQRWMFGCVVAESCVMGREAGQSSYTQTQCLVEVEPQGEVEIESRFLHLVDRRVAHVESVALQDEALRDGSDRGFECVDSLEVDGTRYDSRQEAIERRFTTGYLALELLVREPRRTCFECPAMATVESLGPAATEARAVRIDRQQALKGSIECSARAVGDGLFLLTVRIDNLSLCGGPGCSHEQSQLHSFVSTHTILAARHARFLSSIDPPECWKGIAAGLQNHGAWPVLVGDEQQRDTMLSSPIILYDFPQVAGESPGDLFDATEIDEILSLRVLTLSDDEKRQIRNSDDRAREILARTEMLSEDQFQKLHGAIRGMRRLNPFHRETTNTE